MTSAWFFLTWLWFQDVFVLYSYKVYWGDDGIHGFNTPPCPVLLVGKSRLVLVAVQEAPLSLPIVPPCYCLYLHCSQSPIVRLIRTLSHGSCLSSI